MISCRIDSSHAIEEDRTWGRRCALGDSHVGGIPLRAPAHPANLLAGRCRHGRGRWCRSCGDGRGRIGLEAKPRHAPKQLAGLSPTAGSGTPDTTRRPPAEPALTAAGSRMVRAVHWCCLRVDDRARCAAVVALVVTDAPARRQARNSRSHLQLRPTTIRTRTSASSTRLNRPSPRPSVLTMSAAVNGTPTSTSPKPTSAAGFTHRFMAEGYTHAAGRSVTSSTVI